MARAGGVRRRRGLVIRVQYGLERVGVVLLRARRRGGACRCRGSSGGRGGAPEETAAGGDVRLLERGGVEHGFSYSALFCFLFQDAVLFLMSGGLVEGAGCLGVGKVK